MLQFSKARGISFYLHVVIGLFLMFIFGRIFMPIYPLTDVGMQVVGVFIGVIWLWCFVGFLWPSLIALVAFGLTDFAGFGQVLTMSFGSSVPVLLLFSMILFGSPQHVGATKYITRWFLTRKIFNNRPIVFSFVFFFATYALSVAVNVTPSLILMWTVLYGVLKELNYKKGDKFSTLMLIGTFLGAISGQASLPFTGSTLAILSVFETASGVTMPIPQYMLLGFIYSVVVFIIYCTFMKIVLKPEELKNVANVNTGMFDRDPLPAMSPLQKANFYSMLGFVFLMLLPSFLPDDFIVTELLNTLGATGVAILLTGAMCMIQIKGKPILDFKAVAASSVNWDIFVMVAVAMAIASALTNPVTGVIDMMILIFQPVLGGHSPVIFFVIMLLIGIFITSFASSMVIGIALMPILVAFGIEAGANLPAVAATTTLLLHYSIILPSASVFAAMLWSNEEWVTGKEVFRYGAVIVTVATVVAIAIIMPISLVLF
ncbi:MAG: citrate transporter [Defluviitaleaceae bacterium]|nr:citrate transporter [Defluviitaleaceae bacterium]